MCADLAAQFPVVSPAARTTGFGPLRALVIAAGLGWSLAFIGLGLGYRLQLYGDGSVFSYAVAMEDAWAIHWHNISGRVFVYLFCLAPAEAYVDLTRDVAGGLAVYGLLFFGAPLLGLGATFVLDRPGDRPIFVTACASTASLCPLVFGFPTEMWMAHALFWPTLALCHRGGGGTAGVLAVSAAMLALIFTHEGAVVLLVTILMTLAPRGHRDAAFRRAAGAFASAIAAWITVKTLLRPDDYIAGVIDRARYEFFDPQIFTDSVFALEAVALAGCAALFVALRRLDIGQAPLCSAAIVAAGLTVWWLAFDPPLHTQDRYYLRTALVLGLPCFAALAMLQPGTGEPGTGAWAKRPAGLLSRWMTVAGSAEAARVVAIGLLVLTLVNVVETARFVTAWKAYTTAVRDLATGPASNPELGDPRFVSSDRMDASLHPLSWNSTTLFLSVLLAPAFRPARLVIDPTGNYFWLPCGLAIAEEHAVRAIPEESRRLIRLHACQHR